MKDPNREQEVSVLFRIPKSLDRRLEIAAVTEGITKKEFCRQALENRIALQRPGVLQCK